MRADRVAADAGAATNYESRRAANRLHNFARGGEWKDLRRRAGPVFLHEAVRCQTRDDAFSVAAISTAGGRATEREMAAGAGERGAGGDRSSRGAGVSRQDRQEYKLHHS